MFCTSFVLYLCIIFLLLSPEAVLLKQHTTRTMPEHVFNAAGTLWCSFELSLNRIFLCLIGFEVIPGIVLTL